MASLQRRAKSKAWHCSFRGSDGKWKLVSTGTGDREAAQAACLRMAVIAKPREPQAIPQAKSGELVEAGIALIQAASKGELTSEAGRAFVDRLLRATNQESLANETTRGFLTRWITSKEKDSAPSTASSYKTTVEKFLASLAGKAEGPIAAISKWDIECFRNTRLESVGATTVQGDLRCLSAAFAEAVADGLVSASPLARVKKPIGRAHKREEFSHDEVRQLLEAAPNDEWRTLILLGAYAGMRLGDASHLTWAGVDFTRGTITFSPQKTERRKLAADSDPSEEIPMHPILLAHLEKLAGDTGGLLSPTLGKRKLNGASGLSNTFSRLVRQAGISTGPEGGEGKGRRFSSKSFHSLRHTFVSLMAKAGVSPELRKKLAGHSSEKVHQGYTHHELETLRAAIESIPSPVQ